MTLRSHLRATVGGLPRTYWYVWAGTLVNRMGGFVVPFLALYLTQERGLSVARAGLVVSFFGAGAVVSSFLGGALADALGRRATMLLSLILGGAGMIGLGFLRAPAAIGAGTFALGAVSEIYRPAVSAMIADLVPPEDRLRAYGHLYWAANLGFAVAPAVAGLLAARSYLFLFVADGATTLAYAAIVLARVPESRPHGPRETAAAALAGTGRALRDPTLMAFVALAFGLACIFSQVHATLGIDMRAHGLSPRHFGLLIALNGAVIGILQPFVPRLVSRFRRVHVLAFAAVLVGGGFGLHALARTDGAYALAIVVWTLGEICNAPLAPAIIADLAPAGMRGRYQGTYGLAWGLAAFAGPIAGSELLDRRGSAALWGACAALGVVLAAGHYLIAPARRRRLAELGGAHAEDASAPA